MKQNEFIITYTGKKVYPLDVKPEDINLQDIVHALSNVCRFTGHVKKFYSVAQHSVLVAEQAKDRFPFIWGLLHDSGEAYLPDIATPIKHHFSYLIKAENQILQCVKKKYGLPEINSEQIEALKEADRQVRYWEIEFLMPKHACWNKNIYRHPEIKVIPWKPTRAAFELDHRLCKWFCERDRGTTSHA